MAGGSANVTAVTAATASTERVARILRARRPRSTSCATGGWTCSDRSAAKVSNERTCCSSFMASSFAIEQSRLAETGQPARGTALDRSRRDAEQAGWLGLALVLEIAPDP